LARFIAHPLGLNESAQRLDRRLRIGMLVICGTTLLGGCLAGVGSGHLMPSISACLGAAVILYTVRSEKDILTAIIVQSPAITYICTTLIFSIFSRNISLSGMYDVDRAFLIVSLYQIGILVAYAIVSIILPVRLFNKSRLEGYYKRPYLYTICTTMAASLLFVRFAGIGQSMTQNIMTVLWATVTLSAHSTRKGKYALTFTIGTLTMVILSFVLNQRTYLFSTVLFAILFYTAQSRQAVSFLKIILVVTAGFSLGVISESIIKARPNDRSSIDTAQVMQNTINELGSLETWQNALPNIANSDYSDGVTNKARYYSPFLQGGVGSKVDQSGTIGARLAQIGHMDIVTGGYPIQSKFDADNWLDHIRSVYGAESETSVAPIYSDQLVWNLGIRPRGLIGRPLVSVAGEVYMLSGVWWLIPITAIAYLILFLELAVLRTIIGLNTTYVICGLIALFPIIFTGTALNLVATDIRGIPILIALLWGVKIIAFSKSGNINNLMSKDG
jgi:hypothetical protein